MRYRTEGIDQQHIHHDSGNFETMEEALLGLARTMKDFNQATLKEDTDKEESALINMWREPDSPILYTRIHFERIEMALANQRKRAPSTMPSAPPRRIRTT